jgi:hypothetical protein
MSDDTTLNNYISLLSKNKNNNNGTNIEHDESNSNSMIKNTQISTVSELNHNNQAQSTTNDAMVIELLQPKLMIQNAYSAKVSDRFALKHLTWEPERKRMDFENSKVIMIIILH